MWHVDGYRERVCAVVLYYYHVDDALKGDLAYIIHPVRVSAAAGKTVVSDRFLKHPGTIFGNPEMK